MKRAGSPGQQFQFQPLTPLSPNIDDPVPSSVRGFLRDGLPHAFGLWSAAMSALRRWYRGPARFVTDLRPGTVIKDEAIPSLLRQQAQASFLTINELDFWGKVDIDDRFCVVCFALPDSQVRAIPALLRAVFRLAPFRTKARRMGKVLRVSRRAVRYYTCNKRESQVLRLTTK